MYIAPGNLKEYLHIRKKKSLCHIVVTDNTVGALVTAGSNNVFIFYIYLYFVLHFR